MVGGGPNSSRGHREPTPYGPLCMPRRGSLMFASLEQVLHEVAQRGQLEGYGDRCVRKLRSVAQRGSQGWPLASSR